MEVEISVKKIYWYFSKEGVPIIISLTGLEPLRFQGCGCPLKILHILNRETNAKIMRIKFYPFV